MSNLLTPAPPTGPNPPAPHASMSPFNIGLYRRAMREALPSAAALSAILFAVSGLLAYALPKVQARFVQRGFVPEPLRQMRDALLGVDTSNAGVAEIAFSIAWSHPVVLALMLAQAIITCTRVPAAEVERGTIDVLLALPVSRWQVFVSESVAWLTTAALVFAALYCGSFIGAQFILPEYRPDWIKLARVLANLSLVYAVVGCVALVACSATDRRGRAVIFALVFAVGSLLLNFLGGLWDPAKKLAFLSVLEYYRPIIILRTGAWPWKDMAILAGAAGGLWITAGVWFSRRDLTTT